MAHIDCTNLQSPTYGFEIFNVTKPIILDIESVSGNKKIEALYAYHGSRAGLICMTQLIDGVWKAVAIPIRNNHNSQKCTPIEKFYIFYKEWIKTCKIIVGANMKFDLRLLGVDGIFVSEDCELHDIQVLARLVISNLMSYSVDSLGKKFECKVQKDDSKVKAYLDYFGSVDYGDVPLEILIPYGINDCIAEGHIYLHCLEKLPEESKKVVWPNEIGMTRFLFEIEHRGIHINRRFLQLKKIDALKKMIHHLQIIKTLTNDEINNPGSTNQLAVFFAKRNIAPVAFTETKDEETGEYNASWNAEAIEQVLIYPEVRDVCKHILAYKEAQTADSSFCTPWIECADSNDRIHPDFRSSGTKTGRISAAEPNVYNPPKWIMEAITIPDGYIGVKWDKKQIEYRLFAHYSRDEGLLAKYKENPEVDYHQIWADALGIPRDPTKTLNFGLLYGMGKKKLVRRLAVALAEYDSPTLRRRLRYYYKDDETCKRAIPLDESIDDEQQGKMVKNKDTGEQHFEWVKFPGSLSAATITRCAENILIEYHQKVPAIKKFFKDVEYAIAAKGFVRNNFGRRYYYERKFSYIAVNAIIQGSSADLFKQKLLALRKECRSVAPSTEVIDMIYDSCFAIVRIDEAQAYWNASRRIVESPMGEPFRVPVLIDGEVAIGHWGNITKIKNNNVLESAALVCSFK